MNFVSLIDEALEGCIKAVNPKSISPGEYDVVLPPAAVSDFLFFLAYTAFNGKACNEGRSPFASSMGKKLMSDILTISDDPFDNLSTGAPFDFEGSPKNKLLLIENGVIKACAHDRRSAKIAGIESSGHSLPQPNSYGPIPFNLKVSAGESTLESMIASTERGLYVTHFHYTNMIDPMQQILTGMTRDGLFLIEDGKITGPVNNMRFTESTIKAFSNIAMLGEEPRRIESGFGGFFASPGMKINNFNFTSSTEF